MQNPDVASPCPIIERPPSAGDVRTELDHLLTSPHFEANERRRAFLRYIVEETLAGRADRLKGYAVAVEVFGRDETFDPQSDPVVRLEAWRLRRDLDSYYVDTGRHNAVRISIPKGGYVPRFEWLEESLRSETSGVEQAKDFSEPTTRKASVEPRQGPAIGRIPARKSLIAALIIVAVAVVGWALTTENEPVVAEDETDLPGVVVLPFETLSASEESRYLASGISQELISNLMRFPSFRLYSLPGGFETRAGTNPAKLGRDLGVAYVVSGSVNANGKETRVTAQMVDAGTGRVAWSHTYDRPLTPEALIPVQRDLASDIATVIGQPYGAVNSDLDARLTTPAVSHMQSYVCVLRAYSYRRNFARAELDSGLACLQEAVRRDPDYSDAWAMLGWLHVDAGRNGYVSYNTQDEYKKALQAASEAVRLSPDSSLALKVLATVYHYVGRYDESERTVRQALNVNPYDPETLAQIGWRLSVRGKSDEGIPLLKRAIARTVNPPGWYFSFIAIDYYRKRDYKHMLQAARRSAADGRGFSQMLIAIAAVEQGDREAARQALKKMSGFTAFAREPIKYLQRHGFNDETLNELSVGLDKALWAAAGE